jgi:hypothetical protein
LVGQRPNLEATEALLPAHFFQPFDVDLAALDPEIVVARKGDEAEKLFTYVAKGQSIAAETSKMRLGKFLIYDRSRSPRRLVGILALKSPMYFDGARDRHLGWPRLVDMVAGQPVPNATAIGLRNVALRSIFNVCICMPATPYDQPRVGKLLASLAFSPPVIDHLEQTYKDPVLGLTTTGGWGGSAGQYERIRLGPHRGANQPRDRLYVRTHGVNVSLNYPFHLFSEAVFASAYDFLFRSPQPARPFAQWKTDPAVRRRMLLAAGRLVGLPRRAMASNMIAHYFGAVSDECRTALGSANGIANPPAVRSVPIADILGEWRNQPLPPVLVGVSATPLSSLATAP